MICTEQCQQHVAAINAAREAYASQWPSHCQDCGGNGGTASSYDPSPHGVGLASGVIWDFDPCETCVEQYKCPRCGKRLSEIASGGLSCLTMSGCKWNSDSPDTPLPPECICPEPVIDYELTMPESELCLHGTPLLECDPCMVAGDLAYDVLRERGMR